MSRPLRVEFEGAVYHVTARGNSGLHVYEDDLDRNRFLDFLAQELKQQLWLCHAYCLMGTHWHLLLETPEPNLSCGMARLNSCYSQWFNHRHGRHGHLLQGRYHAILVDKESYLLELCRYVVLNPVRAHMVQRVDQWPWSSYLTTVGRRVGPHWLTTEWVLSHFGSSTKPAQAAYERFVAEGLNRTSPWQNLTGQLFLGSEDFLRRTQARIEARRRGSSPFSPPVPRPHRPTTTEIIDRVTKTFGLAQGEVFNRKRHKEAFLLLVYLLRRVRNMSLKQVAQMAGISPARVSQIAKEFDNPDHRCSLQTRAILKNYKF